MIITTAIPLWTPTVPGFYYIGDLIWNWHKIVRIEDIDGVRSLAGHQPGFTASGRIDKVKAYKGGPVLLLRRDRLRPAKQL